MKSNKTFDKFKSKLIVEAVLNSLLISVSVGLVVGGLIALISWLCGYKDGIWVALGVGAGSAVIAFPLFYFLMFRPSVKSTSRRVDALGLQERAVTMLDYKDDESEMAAYQREDAKRHISSANAKSMKVVIPAWIGIVFACAFVFCATFGTVDILFRNAVVKSPNGSLDPMEIFVAVDYLVEEGGEIQGEANQLLHPGEDATAVTATAMDGYAFTGWSDGNKNPSRTDLKITEDFEVTAEFEPVDDGDGAEDGDFDGNGNDGDSANDQPSEGDAQGGEGDAEGDEPNQGNGSGSGGQDNDQSDESGGKGEGAGGQWSEGNQIIDGETYYRLLLEQYREEELRKLAENEDIPKEFRDFIQAYLESV